MIYEDKRWSAQLKNKWNYQVYLILYSKDLKPDK